MIASAERFKGDIKIFSSGELSIEYLVTGNQDGKPLVFVHSLIASLRQFLPNIAHFAPKYKIVCISLRGHGKSAKPEPESYAGYSLEKFADDIKALCDYLEIESFHYVGNSIGGLIGYELASRYPEKFKSLTTFGSPLKFYFPKWLAVIYSRLMLVIAKIVGIKRYSGFVARQACKTRHGQDFLIKELVDDVNWDVSKYAMVNICQVDYLDVFTRAIFPFMIIRAERDFGFNTLLKSGIKVALKSPNNRVVELEGAGHLANLDRPDEFNRILEQFLSSTQLSN